jgi:3-hydroxy-9,10-secoandrosta-1,3,5(10)-triene-9,17-dione monooxygenase
MTSRFICSWSAWRSSSGLRSCTLLRRDFTYAMRMLRDAMDSLIKISGSSGLMDNNSAQRCWRDVHAISPHVVMNWDVPAENFGRTEFGLPLNPAYPIF